MNDISEWEFPLIPEGFKVDYPKGVNEIPEILKNQNLRFNFEGGVNSPGYGTWIYKSKYSDKKYRWLFDETGNQKTIIDCYYEPWVGKDLVKIETTEVFEVIDSTFQLTHYNGEQIGFELKYKRNPTDKILLILDESIKTGEKLKLSFRIDSKRKFEEIITVPDKSIIGVAGKYRNL